MREQKTFVTVAAHRIIDTPHLYSKKNLQGLITSAKRPWRVYTRFGYTYFVAAKAR